MALRFVKFPFDELCDTHNSTHHLLLDPSRWKKRPGGYSQAPPAFQMMSLSPARRSTIATRELIDRFHECPHPLAWKFAESPITMRFQNNKLAGENGIVNEKKGTFSALRAIHRRREIFPHSIMKDDNNVTREKVEKEGEQGTENARTRLTENSNFPFSLFPLRRN